MWHNLEVPNDGPPKWDRQNSNFITTHARRMKF